MKKVLFSNDFLDQLKGGKKLFSDIVLQYVDIADANFNEITFKNSKLFFATFRNCSFKNAKFVNCEIDTSSSSLLKFFTDISQVTEKDLEEAMNRMGPLVESLDISIKHKIKQEMEQDAQSLGVNMPKGTETHGYSAGTKNYSHPDLVYGMQNFSNMIIDAYNTANPYKGKKSAYEKKDGYKN